MVLNTYIREIPVTGSHQYSHDQKCSPTLCNERHFHLRHTPAKTPVQKQICQWPLTLQRGIKNRQIYVVQIYCLILFINQQHL